MTQSLQLRCSTLAWIGILSTAFYALSNGSGRECLSETPQPAPISTRRVDTRAPSEAFCLQLQTALAELKTDRSVLCSQIRVRLQRCQGLPPQLSTLAERLFVDRSRPVDLTFEEELLIDAAGQLQDANSIELLLNRINRRQKYDLTTGKEIGTNSPRRYLAYWSLHKIGTDACPMILDRIPDEEDRKSRELMVCLLRDLWGTPRTRQQLEDLSKSKSIDNPDKPLRTERIAEAIEFLASNQQCLNLFE